MTDYYIKAIFQSRLGTLNTQMSLVIGGDKTGNDRWYEVHVPIADTLYEQHLEQLRLEGKDG